MAQFTRYCSSDASAPQLDATAGSLIAVLDAVLINGYGSKAAAGWSQPLATSGNCACYQQGAGAGFSFQVNDNGPNGTASYKEAWITGWKTISAVTAPVGTGTGQFPTAAQALTTGHLVARKSFTLNTVKRPWVIYADDRTVYVFIRTGDGVDTLEFREFGFGEFYSYFSTDTNSCFIAGREAENDTQGAQRGSLDFQTTPAFLGFSGCYVADNQAGSSGSQRMYRSGDVAKVSTMRTTAIAVGLLGSLPTPNAADNSLYLAPVLLMDSTWLIRGKFRGLIHVCHSLADIADGTVIVGSNTFAGRTYQVNNPGCSRGHLTVETSNTLDTR